MLLLEPLLSNIYQNNNRKLYSVLSSYTFGTCIHSLITLSVMFSDDASPTALALKLIKKHEEQFIATNL